MLFFFLLGKTTLTEKLRPFGGANPNCCAVNPIRIRTTATKFWTWMAIEKQRGISVCQHRDGLSKYKGMKSTCLIRACVTKISQKINLPNFDGLSISVHYGHWLCVQGRGDSDGETLWKSAVCEIRQLICFINSWIERKEHPYELLGKEVEPEAPISSAIRFLGRSGMGKASKGVL